MRCALLPCCRNLHFSDGDTSSHSHLSLRRLVRTSLDSPSLYSALKLKRAQADGSSNNTAAVADVGVDDARQR